MNAKEIPFKHDKKGMIKLGDLSKNEMCRFIANLAQQNESLSQKLNMAYATYANHIPGHVIRKTLSSIRQSMNISYKRLTSLILNLYWNG